MEEAARKLDRMRYVLVCNGRERDVSSSTELESYLEAARRRDPTELWLNRSDGAALCALINKDNAWLMFLRGEGDSGFSSPATPITRGLRTLNRSSF